MNLCGNLSNFDCSACAKRMLIQSDGEFKYKDSARNRLKSLVTQQVNAEEEQHRNLSRGSQLTRGQDRKDHAHQSCGCD